MSGFENKIQAAAECWLQVPGARYKDGCVRLRNPHIELMDQDILYHLALGSGSHDLQAMFGDVKYVCMGGTPKRMEQFAYFIMNEIGFKLPAGTTLLDISQYSYRYSMYKVGPVLSISHGMGIPSVGILLHEIIKLMYHARVKDPIFFRLGTCGGIGIEGGNIVITEEAVDGMGRPFLELPILGKIVHRPAKLDRDLAMELKDLATADDPWETHVGKTMCTHDFYEGLKQDSVFGSALFNNAVRAVIKHTSTYFIELHVNASRLRCVFAFMALLLLLSDNIQAFQKSVDIGCSGFDEFGLQVSSTKEVLNEWQNRPQMLVARYIKKHLEDDKIAVELSPPSPATVKSPKKMRIVREESQSYE
ncbi:hypothetical protein QYM36_000488 [Artemia franciscana]|uniref:Nucleoside phosphorylase domain-containing protein n=1 Tax=Artemia franciscana TaxID=6661 RepID=A0AA88LGI7_ARTSF|nr:hypothetical protein QYM36_000488 [Artemia franciscana]